MLNIKYKKILEVVFYPNNLMSYNPVKPEPSFMIEKENRERRLRMIPRFRPI